MDAPAHPARVSGTEESVTGLGELEAAVMQVLWDSQEPRSVRAVLDALTTLTRSRALSPVSPAASTHSASPLRGTRWAGTPPASC